MNIERLREVRAIVLAEPARFDMNDYVQSEPCGTACCIGGWGASIAGFIPKRVKGKKAIRGLVDTALESGRDCNAHHLAAMASLGISDFHQAERLFLVSDWPAVFRTAYRNAETRRARARIAAKRITHFIRTDGAE